ncbi:hypothetical protein HAX54_026235 [Datura stramonium]|uniref:USP domain-containing protein n=1 Tax=Datura stramonium TaxID=4076 RepID=A0ABS8S742_DATST|nr:hypothetical protein [Datura stramonium]
MVKTSTDVADVNRMRKAKKKLKVLEAPQYPAVCYVRNFQNKWYKVDDSLVKPVEQKESCRRERTCFFTRGARHGPEIMRSLTIPRDPRRSSN